MPPPEGVAHVPSPRQNVLDDADVPELRLPTGKFPVTPPAPPAAKLMAGIIPLARIPPEPISATVLAAEEVEKGTLEVRVVGLPAIDNCPVVSPEMPPPPLLPHGAPVIDSTPVLDA